MAKVYSKHSSLPDLLAADRRRALDRVNAWNADALLAENIDVLVAEVVGQYDRESLSFDWDTMVASEVGETTLMVSDWLRDRPIAVAGQRLTIEWELNGDYELLLHRGSEAFMNDVPGDVRERSVLLTIEGRELTTAQVKGEIDRARDLYTRLADFANRDLLAHHGQLAAEVREAIERRRTQLLANRDLTANLGIPMRPTPGAGQMPVAVRRKVMKVNERRQSAIFAPEPVLEQAYYEDILSVITHWARAMERSPELANKFEEEQLRDQLLMMLNSHWEGQAGSEMFNGRGKTDLLVREGDRNVFIGECKIWTGQKAAAEAIDQLLGYLVWRDSKAALIVFIRAVKVGQAIERLHEAVAAHPACLITRPGTDPNERVDYLLRADDEERTINLAVLPVAIPTSARR